MPPVDRDSLQALKDLLSQADLALDTKPPSIKASRENLKAASAITDDLIQQSKTKGSSAAATLGHKGGSVTSQRYGPEHYRQMAAKRKTRAGGRQKKQIDKS